MPANTWPGGYRHAMDQSDHESWNARNYPGTLQLCVNCESPTGRCEEDELCVDERGPFCEECYATESINESGDDDDRIS